MLREIQGVLTSPLPRGFLRIETGPNWDVLWTVELNIFGLVFLVLVWSAGAPKSAQKYLPRACSCKSDILQGNSFNIISSSVSLATLRQIPVLASGQQVPCH